MSGWRITQLTSGSDKSRYHSHSYYDIPVFNGAGDRIVAHRMTMQGRDIEPADRVEVGFVDIAKPEHFEPLAQTSAWSWQQGPLAQWVAGGPHIVFNSREGGLFRARLLDTNSGESTLLARTVYAVAPDGEAFYGLNMRRLETLRPGYGYATHESAPVLERAPASDGIWRMDRDGGKTLLVSIADLRDVYFGAAPARERLYHRAKRFTYWLNHLKLSPDGTRFTVKLRWRRIGGPWSDKQGASLTGRVDGTQLRVLAKGLSHVIWLNERQLYAWQSDALILFDDAPHDRAPPKILLPDLVKQNVHMRHLPPGACDTLQEAVFDTPYKETVDLVHYRADGEGLYHSRIARFTGHAPARGRFRCDLHPCPSADGKRIALTSLRDGGRQIYLVERED